MSYVAGSLVAKIFVGRRAQLRSGDKLNFLIFVLDTVGAKHIPLYGYSRNTMPNLREIAAEALVFTRCFSTACWTPPAHASLFTGMLPSQCRTYETQPVLRKGMPTLAARLAAIGYYTFGISCNPMVSRLTGYGRGFQSFQETTPKKLLSETGEGFERLRRELAGKNDAEQVRTLLRLLVTRPDLSVPAGIKLVNAAWTRARRWRSPIFDATPHTNKAIVLLKKQVVQARRKGKPFFGFVNIMQAHSEYHPPPPYFGTFFQGDPEDLGEAQDKFRHYAFGPFSQELLEKLRDLYDEELLFLDAKLREIYEWYVDTDLRRDTVLIITADHGEHLGEKGLVDHMFSLYNEVLWIPLIFRFPDGYGIRGFRHILAQITDIYATIMELSGIRMRGDLWSRSLLGKAGREVAVAQIISAKGWLGWIKRRNPHVDRRHLPYAGPMFALIDNKLHKLITRNDGNFEAYDLKESMDETVKISDERVVEELLTLATELKKETGFDEVVAREQDERKSE